MTRSRIRTRVVVMAATALCGLVGGCSTATSASRTSNTKASAITPTSAAAPSTIATTVATPITTTPPAPTTTVLTLGDERPFNVLVPDSYDPSMAAPLLIVLHGYTANGDLQEGYFGFAPLAEKYGMVYVHPDGLKDAGGNGYWNATDVCCDFEPSGVDDVAYLLDVIDTVSAAVTIDPRQVYIVGHSNGGFMANRLACDHPDRIAAIVSLAGAHQVDPDCATSSPVSVLQIHGSDDPLIQFAGGEILGDVFPSAPATVAAWAADDGCAAEPTPTDAVLDLDSSIAGAESTVSVASGCPDGIAVELWTIVGGVHTPVLSATFSETVVEFLLAHPKPSN